MISKKLAIDVLNESLSTGADYAEIFFEDSTYYTTSLENGKETLPLAPHGVRLENQCMVPTIYQKRLLDLAIR